MSNNFILPFGSAKHFLVAQPGQIQVCLVRWKDYKKIVEESTALNFRPEDIAYLLKTLKDCLRFFVAQAKDTMELKITAPSAGKYTYN
jgi:hypothetical protein